MNASRWATCFCCVLWLYDPARGGRLDWRVQEQLLRVRLQQVGGQAGRCNIPLHIVKGSDVIRIRQVHVHEDFSVERNVSTESTKTLGRVEHMDIQIQQHVIKSSVLSITGLTAKLLYQVYARSAVLRKDFQKETIEQVPE
ncbi:hypothetical protein BaRGS_00003010 [Batillaria attramentaria]|uniref:Secreted protein n=1 Tax=Batillaria attramentaria TaxID=370345 RepID=A0ABD0M1R3_9CAEN